MDKSREGEIARAFLKHTLKEEGLTINRFFRRRIGNVAKAIDVPFEELLDFATTLATELVIEVSEKGKPATPEELEGVHEHFGHGGH